jgi:hypothetical protein
VSSTSHGVTLAALGGELVELDRADPPEVGTARVDLKRMPVDGSNLMTS